MHAIVPPGLVRLEVRQEVQALNFNSPSHKAMIPPGSYEGKLVRSDNGVGWVVLERNGISYGWSYAVLASHLDEDRLRLFKHGRDIDSIDEL